MEKDYERLTELTCFRAESRLESAIGHEFNNETLMLVNAVAKARSSIDLSMGNGSDAGHGIILVKGDEGFPMPFDLLLTKMIRDIEYSVLDGEEPRILSDFLLGPAGLTEDRVPEVEKEIASIEKRAAMTGRKKMDRDIWQAARRYQLMMTSEKLDFQYRDILARLYLYRDLILHDERLSGMNIEQALLIRREDHDRAIRHGKLEQVTLLVAECMLESVYAGADRLELASRSAMMASEYLSSRLEKNRNYTMKEIADTIGLRPDMTATLFVLPALTGDRMAVEPAENGGDLYRLIG